MAGFNYLWTHRAKFPINSVSFYRAWGKRLFSLAEVLRRNRHRSRLTRQGAVIHETAEIGEVKVSGPKVNLRIGAFSFLGKVNIALHDEVIIGDNVCINDGVQILTASHAVTDPNWTQITAKIIIEDYAWIAINAILLPGVRIGKGAIVGAGAVVSKNVAAGTIVAGNPAKVLSKKRGNDLVYNPCDFLAGNRAWLLG
jgi:maltose O-acetyltransferase